jgi:hypothetical protein
MKRTCLLQVFPMLILTFSSGKATISWRAITVRITNQPEEEPSQPEVKPLCELCRII